MSCRPSALLSFLHPLWNASAMDEGMVTIAALLSDHKSNVSLITSTSIANLVKIGPVHYEI